MNEHGFELIIEYPNGGCLYIHFDATLQAMKKALTDPENAHIDWQNLNLVGHEKAKNGHRVEILPEVDENDIQGRANLLPGVKGNKNPDFRVNGEYVELKAPKSSKKRALKDRIDEGAKQANHIIVIIPEQYDAHLLEQILKRKFQKFETLKSVEIIFEGEYILHLREDYIK